MLNIFFIIIIVAYLEICVVITSKNIALHAEIISFTSYSTVNEKKIVFAFFNIQDNDFLFYTTVFF